MRTSSHGPEAMLSRDLCSELHERAENTPHCADDVHLPEFYSGVTQSIFRSSVVRSAGHRVLGHTVFRNESGLHGYIARTCEHVHTKTVHMVGRGCSRCRVGDPYHHRLGQFSCPVAHRRCVVVIIDHPIHDYSSAAGYVERG